VSKEGSFNLDLKDFIVRTAVITHNHETMFPNPEPLPMLDAKPKKKSNKELEQESAPKDLKAETLRSALQMGVGLASIVGMGVLCPDPAFMTMSSIFALSVVAG